MPRERWWDKIEKRARVPVHVFGGENEDDPVYVVINNAMDCLVDAIKTIDYAHHEIHEGNHYMADIVDLTLAVAGTLSLSATIPADSYCHFRHIVNVGGACHVKVKEGVGLEAGGAVTIYNSNRNSPDAPFGALSKAVITGGTQILEYIVASGGGPKAAGGEGGLFEEIVTQDDQTYSIEVTNLTNGTIAASIVVGFYIRDIGVCP